VLSASVSNSTVFSSLCDLSLRCLSCPQLRAAFEIRSSLQQFLDGCRQHQRFTGFLSTLLDAFLAPRYRPTVCYKDVHTSLPFLVSVSIAISFNTYSASKSERWQQSKVLNVCGFIAHVQGFQMFSEWYCIFCTKVCGTQRAVFRCIWSRCSVDWLLLRCNVGWTSLTNWRKLNISVVYFCIFVHIF